VKRRVEGEYELAASLGVSQLKHEFRTVGYSTESNGVSTEAEESPLLRTVTGKRLVKTD
jgi:hypothetical protein